MDIHGSDVIIRLTSAGPPLCSGRAGLHTFSFSISRRRGRLGTPFLRTPLARAGVYFELHAPRIVKKSWHVTHRWRLAGFLIFRGMRWQLHFCCGGSTSALLEGTECTEVGDSLRRRTSPLEVVAAKVFMSEMLLKGFCHFSKDSCD